MVRAKKAVQPTKRLLLVLLTVMCFTTRQSFGASHMPTSKKKAARISADLEKAYCEKQYSSIEPQDDNKEISLVWPISTYFIHSVGCALVYPALPRVVNEIVSGGESVTFQSAGTYGLLTGLMGLCGFLTVSGAGTLSDQFGRKPFLILSAIGLGMNYLAACFGKSVWILFLGAMIAGSTQFMQCIGNAFVADVVRPEKLPEALALFIGIGKGASFMLGIPLGGVLSHFCGYRAPIYAATGLCVLNLVYMVTALPEPLSRAARNIRRSKRGTKVDLRGASPLGALKMVKRSPLITSLCAIYLCSTLATTATVVNWVNYCQYKYGWGAAHIGLYLTVASLLFGALPRMVIPKLGVRNSITCGLLMQALGQLVLFFTPPGRWPLLLVGTVFNCLGAAADPALLGLLTNQVPASEVGALQGACETIRALTISVGNPIMAHIFGFFISDKRSIKVPGADLVVASILLFISSATARAVLYGHHNDIIYEVQAPVAPETRVARK
uniref:Major facilitator superfamily (MFS) profile domain-containing protein n=1 Tax=Fibrocapsa japonica TaxID=94617 RepID=A0A7S2XVI5_9STRA|mmetsp:Transcript_12848/g.18960  ORF Transcript_12848/g.18960 Transcript_12848/m.18960 type:complete len:498 (+) Transcript_12848:44-1537(+)